MRHAGGAPLASWLAVFRALRAWHRYEAVGLETLLAPEIVGDRHYAAQGYVFRATSAMLTLGFTRYGLECINAWAVECNHASLRILRKLNFKPIGRQRSCHYIDGQPFDRLLFELQSNDHRTKPELVHKNPFSF